MMNNYIFIRVVGKGSYGEVNLVKHKSDRKQYVIKKLNLTTSSKRERRAAEQEAQLLSQLRHPNIVTYRESWEGDDRQLYIVMGFCEGGDLYHRLKQQKGELLPERQVVEWFVQIAMALQYLHERNILHRDLKTQNIFLTKTNIIKVGDLGIARVLENQNDMASTLIGTPYYMSPELFSNKPYNHKSDVWALGCCVYEMSTLKHAFNARDMNSLVYRIVEGKLPQMPSRYDPQLGDLIKSMLCKRPEDRPDVKLILRQPYIKRQIAMFLEATKEKTAKSRKKAVSGSGDCRANNASSVVSPQPKPERLPPSPQPEPLARVKRKEEKPQQHKVWNGNTDCTPVQTPPPPKPSSPDALKCSLVSLATVSNINIDIQLKEDEELLQVQRPQSVVSHQCAGNEHVTHSVHKDSKGRGKPDPSPPPSPVKPPLKAVSGVGSRGGDERRAPNGLLDIQPQATPNPGDTFSVLGEKQMSDVDDKDDTMELLQEANMQTPKPEEQKVAAFSAPERRSAYKSNIENIGVVVEVNMDNKNDTVTLLKGAPIQQLYTSDIQEVLESTEKLLEPVPPTQEPDQVETSLPLSKRGLIASCQTTPQFSSEPSISQQNRARDIRWTHGDQDKSKLAPPRPLPPPPIESRAMEGRKRNRRSTESKKTGVVATSTSASSCKEGLLPLPQDRPLSARERRRLRQSQESTSQPGVGAVRRASYDVTSTNAEHYNVPISRSVSDSIAGANSTQDKLLERRSDDDECSSSTSSTERSEGDCRERKAESSDMQDLVHMMTQTLRMDVGDGVSEVDKGRSSSTALPEFRLNRKYRDTLVLHGKAQEEAENLSLGEIPIGSTSGPAKIRRAIEHLRTDVVKGLGVKLLDRVLEIMEEEDDTKRELCLRDQMGDEKYQTYAVMVRQLKFFEDIAFKV
ncbi:serine/threonine-protein kinase Nek4 isoform X1 [Seriola aureovittata]|uniref:serine/threonine-protein kinase Nek4 isoform X1 n=1 Tax=Seriola aureovittata TaxID=2871759 RepID=UPI0024BE601E|nr:serine/threonine-protein kinase Nek4 isoform X1 [Seriola aureovittata]